MALPRDVVTAGSVQAFAGFPALDAIKSIWAGCGRHKRKVPGGLHARDRGLWEPPAARSPRGGYVRCSQKVPRQPELQVHAPLTWSHAAPCSH